MAQEPTVFISANPDRDAFWPRTHICVSPHPYFVLCPFFQIVDLPAGVLLSDALNHMLGVVLSFHRLVRDGILCDGSIAALSRWWYPTYPDGGRAGAYTFDLLGWGRRG